MPAGRTHSPRNSARPARLVYSTYLGGVNLDIANAIAVDSTGAAYIAGQTTSANLASILVSQNPPTGVFDAFVVKLVPTGDSVAALLYLGGVGADNATAIAVDAASNMYLAGWTLSPNLPVVNGFQTINGGNYSAFVGKLNFSGGAVSVSVTPPSAALYASQAQQFSATVANSSNTAVTWSISPSGVGAISGAGLYTAPASITTQQTVTVTATSVADVTKSSSAAVKLYPPVVVMVTPPTATLSASQTQQFSATVTNSSNTTVTWSISPSGVGTISSAGLYTAPANVITQQVVTITATSAADTAKWATAIVTLVPTGPAVPLRFVPVTPCRLADTRNAGGPFGGPRIGAGSVRNFTISDSGCGIPAKAQAYSLNVGVVPAGPLGYLTLWPAGQAQPVAATLNSLDGRVKSNAAIIPSGIGGAISIFASNSTDVVLDVNGYFVPATDPTGLAFYPIIPCRIADTRGPTAPLGGPSLTGGRARDFPIFPACNIPASAQAYSLNFAAIPPGPLGYLTAWPSGQSQPLVASLAAVTGAVTANSAIVPAGSSGAIALFASNSTDLVIDVNGYFAPMTTGGLSLYSVTPCRVLDTRQAAGATPLNGKSDVPITGGPCGVPTAPAYVLSATVAPFLCPGVSHGLGEGPKPAHGVNAQCAGRGHNFEPGDHLRHEWGYQRFRE